MQLKKIIAIFLAAALTFSALVVPASAEPAEYLKVGVEAMTATPISTTPQIFNQGDEVTVKVSISQNTGVIFLKFAVFFDTDAFEYIGYESKELIPSEAISVKGNYISYFMQTTSVTTATGELFEIKLKVKETFCGDAEIYAQLWQNRDANCARDNGISSNKPVPFTGESVTLKLHNIDAAAGVVTAPNCTEEGYTTYQCSACEQEVVGNIVAANGHTPAEAVVENKIDSNCTEDGSYDDVVYCEVCDAELSREEKVIEKLGHDLIPHEAKDPTCTEIGWDAYDTCSRCDYTTYVEKEALGHDLIPHESKDPTCTEIGHKAYETCARCDYTTYEAIDATGHDAAAPVEENRVEATCTENGSYDSVVYCKTCGAELSREKKTIEKLGHDLTSHEAKAPTCTEIGWNAYDTCSRCDYTTYAEIAPCGHDAAEAVVENRVEPTCTEDGSYDSVVYCKTCGAELSREVKLIGKLGHDSVPHDSKAPTCTEIGWDTYVTCTRCDYTTYVEKAALGHDLTKVDAKAPTCTEIGWDAYDTCSRCDYTTYVEKAALGHDMINVDAKAPTCTEIGWNAYEYCSRCDYSTYVEIEATGHDAAEAVVENRVEPTCTETGSYDLVVYCKTCGAELSREEQFIDKLGHDLVPHDAKAPTCTEIGWDAYNTCNRCDYTTYAEKAALGHDLTKVDAKAPTCTEIGWDAYEFCSECDYTTYVEKAALGHKYGESTVVDPEYKQEGYTTHTCTVCGFEEKYDIVPGLTYILGDTNGDEKIDSDDAINLLYYTLLPESYSVNQKCDFNGDGVVNSDDAVYLLYFTLLPEQYPLHK